ncbi:MAG: hypothetical protein Q7R39_01470 [Dehalococcoidia bacterium]|nr:hypothetical protein [Dehalococcoidia bacterium]
MLVPEITPAFAMSVVGCAFLSAVAVQLAKGLMPETAWRGLACNALAIVSAFIIVGAGLWVTGAVDGPSLYSGAITALLAAAVSTYGYEAIDNIMKAVGGGVKG